MSNAEKNGLNETAVQEILDGMPETSMNNTSEADAPALPVLSSSIYLVRNFLEISNRN
jgi:hypothetical protein